MLCRGWFAPIFTLIKIIIILALLYFLVRKNFDLGLSLAICALATAVLFLMPPISVLQTIWHTTFSGKYFFNQDTWNVLLLVFLIMILSGCLKESGATENLVGSVRKMFVDNRFTIGALPAMIGLLPMPGGALFSAPMIEGLSDEADLSPEDRTFLNYWFRHVWEYSYPLYPGLILLAVIINVPLNELIRYMFPLSLAAILGGSIFGLLKIQKHIKKRLKGREFTVQLLKFVKGFWPILLILIGYVGFKVAFLIVLPITILIFGLTQLGPGKLLRVARKSINYKLILTIYSVLIFKDIINASGAVDDLARVFNEWGVPHIFLFIVLPLLIGYLTGITHSYVSVAFPLILPFLMDSSGNIDFSSVQLAYTWGFIGILFSPVHLCIVLSSKYFGADIMKVFRIMIPPAIVLAVVSFALYYFT